MRILGFGFLVTKPLVWRSAIPSAGRHRAEIIRRETPWNLRNVCVDWQNWWNNTRQRQSFWAIRKIWTATRRTKQRFLRTREKEDFPRQRFCSGTKRFSTIAAERSLREVGLNHNQRKASLTRWRRCIFCRAILTARRKDKNREEFLWRIFMTKSMIWNLKWLL